MVIEVYINLKLFQNYYNEIKWLQLASLNLISHFSYLALETYSKTFMYVKWSRILSFSHKIKDSLWVILEDILKSFWFISENIIMQVYLH